MYTKEIILLMSWPVFVYLTYTSVYYLVRKFEERLGKNS